jgi:hypothetical protein
MFLSFVDFISPRITLFHNNILYHTSIASIILSFVTISIIIVFSIIFSLDFILKKNPTSFYYKRYVDDAGVFPLNSSSLFHYISLLNDFEMGFDDTMLTVIGSQISEERARELKYNRSLYSHWIYGLCTDQDIDEYKKVLDYQQILMYEKSYCIKYYYDKDSVKLYSQDEEGFKYPTVERGQSNENAIYYGIIIQRCDNNSYYSVKFNKCQTKENIENYMNKLNGYGIYLLDKNTDINNYKEPFQYFFNKITNKFNLMTYTSNNLNFNTALIKTITGIIFDLLSERKTYIYLANEKLVTEKDETNDIVYGTIYFWMQNMQEVYQRKYKKLQDISASIGGIINLIMVLSKIIYKLFEKYILINDMINNLKVKCNEVVKNIYKTDFKELKFQKTDYNHNNVKNNNYFDVGSKQKINLIETPELKKIDQLNDIKRANSTKFNLSFSKIVKLSSLNYNKFKRISYMEILLNDMFCIKKRNLLIDKLDDFRKNIISEEGLFTTYYILMTLISKNNEEVK